MKILSFILFALLVSFTSCTERSSEKENVKIGSEEKLQNEQAFIKTLKTHLKAVSDKDLAALKSTMSPKGNMQLILPGSEILSSVDKFMEYHEKWFQNTSWTFETKILNTEIGDRVGIAVTEIMYREPERDGKPYYNRMIVSYGLEKIGDTWYIIQDHASSIEKSTDKN